MLDWICREENIMGQYYIIANMTKEEYLEPYVFQNGAKLLEFSTSSGGIMTALALLLVDSNGRGGGDFYPNRSLEEKQEDLVGSWAGDSIVLTGDYGDSIARYQDVNLVNLYDYAQKHFKNISEDIRKVMLSNDFLASLALDTIEQRLGREENK